jgi:hypothetical protein
MADIIEDIALSAITQDLKKLIATAKNTAVSYVNMTLAVLYWHIGKRMVDEGLKDDRNKYGNKTINNISLELVQEYGQGFTASNLSRMMGFAELYPDDRIVATLSHKLSWS